MDKVRILYLCLLSSIWVAMNAANGLALPLSPGDRIKVTIPEGELFNGSYAVTLDGSLNIPHLPAIAVVGQEPAQVEQIIKQTLTEKKLFNPNFVQVSVQALEWAPIQVHVSGSTFQPGRVLINERSPEALNHVSQASGDYPPERFLTVAIRSAGGILPSADVRRIKLIRNQQEMTFDLSGIFNGEPVGEVPLVAGDQIIVPDTGRFQNELVRPSQISLGGVRVFLSNLTQPASGNAGAGVNKEASGFTYGTRLSQALIAVNCAGGNASNSRRRAVLVRTDRTSGKTQAFDYAIEETLRKSNDNQTNPFLMPEDGIACYDSRTTNIRGVAQILGDIFSPFSLLLNLLK